MRLINTATLGLEEFSRPGDIPQYAILSHKWLDEEVTLESFEKMRNRLEHEVVRSQNSFEKTCGYRKVRSFCEIARARGLQYAWADTCCIDKTNSAELSEAINSMMKWYEQAEVCIVYLVDVSLRAAGDEDVFQQFESSSWFKRGWTLQELLVPRRLIFYSASWERIGSLDRDEHLLDRAHAAPLNLSPPRRAFLTSLERASHIKVDDLCIISRWQTASVAQRMYWASHRSTTRPEDSAYSLLGLFNVFLPLIYGEGGTNGFTRLQREILEANADESVFAWTPPLGTNPDHVSDQMLEDGNVLASSPAAFCNSNEIERTPINLDRALVMNCNGIDIHREADHLCIFRRQRGLNDEQLLFIMQLGCERNIPGRPSDPCVMALLAEIESQDAAPSASIDELMRSPITISRRVRAQNLSTSTLSDLGFELVQAKRRSRYRLWLPFENILPKRKGRIIKRARLRSRL